MNNYLRLPDLKRVLNNEAANTAEHSRLLAGIEGISRAIDDHCGVQFYNQTATRYPPPSARYCDANEWGRELLLPWPVVSLSEVKVDDDGDDTFELTLAASADYFLEAEGANSRGEPYWRLRLNSNGTQITRWPRDRRRVRLTGVFGWPLKQLATGLTGTLTTTSDTTITTSAAADSLIYPGDTILMGSEQMDVTAVSSTTVTVERGINGTTAATYSAVAITVLTYPAAIQQAARAWATRMTWDEASGWAGSVNLSEMGVGAPQRSSSPWAQVTGLLAPYRNLRVA